MSRPGGRKAQPNCVRFFLNHFRNNNLATIDQLTDLLINRAGYQKSTAAETIKNAIADGMIKGAIMAPRIISFAVMEDIPDFEHDPYCYECHLPGVVEQCRDCSRSFHRLCYRKDPERPNYSMPSSKEEKHRLPIFDSNVESDSDEEGDENFSTAQDSSTAIDESEARAVSSLMLVDQADGGGSLESPLVIYVESASDDATVSAANTDSLEEGKPTVYDLNTESKGVLEVVCMGEVRPPNRKRPATAISNLSYKSEMGRHREEQENETDAGLCTCCRLAKIKELRNPPNLKTNELCYLLGFIFARNHSWVSADISGYLDALKPELMTFVKKFLFHLPEMSLEKIKEKINAQEYEYLMDFLIDILDVQHNIGIFFGHNSTELESTKWLIRDVTHELCELRRCSDCFRYSNEQDQPLWFAKPCVQRHELVYAKQAGFSYWPAKVVRVVANNSYDVRFFGSTHSRALIDVRFIRSIDTDIKSLKLGSSTAMKKALEELHYHQILSKYPPSKFSYHANKSEMADIIHTVMDMGGREKGKRGRTSKKSKKNPNTMQQQQQQEQPPLQTNNVLITMAPTVATNESANSSGSIIQCIFSSDTEATPSVPKNRQMTRSAHTVSAANESNLKEILEELEKAHEAARLAKLKVAQLEKRMHKLEEALRKKNAEQRVLKRSQWCKWCLNNAVFMCCFRAAYCSALCQQRDWDDGHNGQCCNNN